MGSRGGDAASSPGGGRRGRRGRAAAERWSTHSIPRLGPRLALDPRARVGLIAHSDRKPTGRRGCHRRRRGRGRRGRGWRRIRRRRRWREVRGRRRRWSEVGLLGILACLSVDPLQLDGRPHLLKVGVVVPCVHEPDQRPDDGGNLQPSDDLRASDAAAAAAAVRGRPRVHLQRTRRNHPTQTALGHPWSALGRLSMSRGPGGTEDEHEGLLPCSAIWRRPFGCAADEIGNC